jgi:hypothetical protein
VGGCLKREHGICWRLSQVLNAVSPFFFTAILASTKASHQSLSRAEDQISDLTPILFLVCTAILAFMKASHPRLQRFDRQMNLSRGVSRAVGDTYRYLNRSQVSPTALSVRTSWICRSVCLCRSITAILASTEASHRSCNVVSGWR